MIHWLTTSPNPRSSATGHDAGQRGWKLHAVDLDVNVHRALCGLFPRHGWGLDLFIDDKCKKCVKKVAFRNATSSRI
jgi:hypothetical protein